MTIKHLSRQMAGGIDFSALQGTLVKTKRVDLVPLNGDNSRGFQIILDSKVALYFYQDGDHFSYDGYEVGEYEKGDITILDHLKKHE